MDKSQETQVSVPETPLSGSRLEPAPAKLEVEADMAQTDTEQVWHWCPTCKLASLKAVACPSCGTAYVVVPEAGIPGTPHMPKVAAGRSRRALIGSLAGALALVGGIAAGIFLLVSHGASPSDLDSAPVSGNSVDGRSSFSVPSLHGSLKLRRVWGTNMQHLQLPTTITGGAKVRTELAIGNGGELITIGSFDSVDPSSALNMNVTTAPQTSADQMGNKITTDASREVAIAGYTAVAQDFEVRNAKGGLIQRGTTYWVNAGSRVVLIRATTPPSQASDLGAIEQALVNVG